jgi:predicted dithiol-disulfide oxidoreductase (DUF899 family)
MSLPEVVSREEWLAARRALLAREKALTRQRDAVNADRRRLPMVRVENYVFDGLDGEITLRDLFGDSRQLVVQHFMFGPDWETGCPMCTADVDELAPALFEHLRERATAYAAVSRAPIAKLDAYRRERGWTIQWVSSYRSTFNYDLGTTLDETVAPALVNFTPKDEILAAGKPNPWVDAKQPVEVPGFSCFLRDGDALFHTYSAFARGVELINGTYGFLDLTALGRQEPWEEPKDRA